MQSKKQDIHRGDLRNFGFLIAGAIAVWWIYATVFQDKLLPMYYLLIALVLAAIAIDTPRVFYYPYRFWMWLGKKMGAVMSRVILTIFFFAFLTPIALVRRLFSKDPLEMRWHEEAPTYFRPKIIQKPPQFERMF